MTSKDFIEKFKFINERHSKRSPRKDELRTLMLAGQELTDSASIENKDSIEILEHMLQIYLLLEENERFIVLFERMIAQKIKLKTSHVKLLKNLCDVVLPGRFDADLKDRVGYLRQQVLSDQEHLAPAIRARLSDAGKSSAVIMKQLQAIPASERTPAQQVTVAAGLLEQCEGSKGSAATIVKSIKFVDAYLPALDVAGERHRILTWLSILTSAKCLHQAHNGRADEGIGAAINQATYLDDAIRQPLTVVRQCLEQLTLDGGNARFRYIRAVMNLEVLWRFDFVGGRALRYLVFDEVLTALEKGQTFGVNGNAIALRLFRCMGQCENFWLSKGQQERTLQRYFKVLKHVEEPRQAVIRGICHLAIDEQEAAEALFAQRRDSRYDVIFNGSGHVTFMPSATAAQSLEREPADRRFLPEECQFTFVKPLVPDADALTTVACADPGYLKKYYLNYTNSLFAKDKTARAHFHLLGDVSSVDAETMALLMGNDRVSLSTENPPVKAPYYYATARFLRAPLFLQAAGSDIILTDMDIQFMEAPSGLGPHWRSAGSIGLRLYDKIRSFSAQQYITVRPPRMETWGTLNASCLYLGLDSDAKAFAEDLSRVSHFFLATFQHSQNSNWWIDQNIIFAALRVSRELHPSLQIFNLLDVGIPFGAFRFKEESALPAYGHHPAMPLI